MKQVLLLLTAILAFSCKQDEKKEAPQQQSNSESTAEGTAANMTPSQATGKEIFEGKGNCFTCHREEQKAIGPSIMEIAKIYKEKNGSIPAFLKEKAEPIVDPSQYEVMKTNFPITKTFSDEELKAVEDYIFSFSK